MALEDLPFEAQRNKFHEYLDAIRGEDEIYAHILELLYSNEDLQSELEYLLDFTRYGDKEEKKMAQGYEGVVLTTEHSSKGLEWDYVFNSISKYDSERLHRNSRQTIARKEEMRRLMFVSMTRAREELFVSGQYICYGNREDGYTPSQSLYSIIERHYRDFNGDKDAFCKAYKKNADWIATKIQHEADMQAVNAQIADEKTAGTTRHGSQDWRSPWNANRNGNYTRRQEYET